MGWGWKGNGLGNSSEHWDVVSGGGRRGLGEVTQLSVHSPRLGISDSGFNPSAAYPEASLCWPRAGGGGRRAKATLASEPKAFVPPRLPVPHLAL